MRSKLDSNGDVGGYGVQGTQGKFRSVNKTWAVSSVSK